MNRYSEQGVLVNENYDHTQRHALQIIPQSLKFHFGIFARIMDDLSPVEDVKDVVNIYLSLYHLLFIMIGQSYPSIPSLGNLSDAPLDFLNI
jgi:hypothetical protein